MRYPLAARRGRDLIGLAIIAAAIVLRVFDLGRRSLWLDEAWAAIGALDGPFDVAHVRTTPLLFAGLVRLSVAALGRTEVAVRLPATLFSIAAVVITYRLGRALLGVGGARLAAAIVGLLPIPIYYGKEMKHYAAELCLALAIAWLVGHVRRSPGWRLGWVTLALGTLVGPGLTAIAPLLAAGALAVLVPAARRAPIAYGATLLTAALASAGWVRLVYVRQVAGDADVVTYWHLFYLPRWPPTAVFAAGVRSAAEASTFGLGTALPGHNDAIVRLATLPPAVAWALAAAMLLGAAHLVRRGERWFPLLVLTWHLLFAGAAAAGRYPYGPARIALFFLGPTAVLLAAAASAVAAGVPKRGRAAAWLVLATPLLWPLDGSWRENVTEPMEREEIRPVLQAVFSRRRADDTVWVSFGATSAFRFYVPYPDAHVTFALLPFPEAVRATLAATLARGRVWAIFGHRQASEEPMALRLIGPVRVLDRIAATGASAVLLGAPGTVTEESP